MNDMLTWLAVVGIMMFVAAFILVAICFAQEALVFLRMFRGGRAKLQLMRLERQAARDR